MDAVKSLEAKLDEIFVKNAPYQLPAGLKKWIGEYAWILALVGAVLGGLAFIGLLGVLGLTSVVATVAGAGGYVLFAWLALVVLGIEVALLIMAVGPLKEKKKRGWDLLFYSQLISVVFNLFNWLQGSNFGANALSFVWNLIWITISLYLLFQVRSQFTRKA